MITATVKEPENGPRLVMEGMTSLIEGQSMQVMLKVIYEDRTENVKIDKNVIFTSSDEKVAKIDKKGKIKAKKAGKTMITAEYQNMTTSYELIVYKKGSDPNVIQWIEFEELDALQVGESIQAQLLAVYSDRSEPFPMNDKVKWKSNDEKVATIKAGQTTITAKYKNFSANMELFVIAGEQPVRIEFENLSAMKEGQTLKIQLQAVYPDRTEALKLDEDVKLTSSNEKVATIDKKGELKAKKAGTTTITAKYHDLTVSYELVVMKKK